MNQPTDVINPAEPKSYKYYMFQIYLGKNEELAQVIIARAKEMGLSRSEYMRRAIAQEILTKSLTQEVIK